MGGSMVVTFSSPNVGRMVIWVFGESAIFVVESVTYGGTGSDCGDGGELGTGEGDLLFCRRNSNTWGSIASQKSGLSTKISKIACRSRMCWRKSSLRRLQFMESK